MPGLKRRDFLTGLAASAAMPARAAWAEAPREPDVVVIGAGMAGLSAAAVLIAEGAVVTVIEARGRIGGRAHTESALFGKPIDHGAAWLHSADRNPLAAIAKRLGFETELADGDVSVYRGTEIVAGGAKRLNAALERFGGAIEEAGGAGRDVAAGSLFEPENDIDRLAEVVAGPLTHGVELARLSTMDAYGQIGTGVEHLVPLGLGSLVAAYGRGLPVKLSTPAKKIGWGGKGVEVETEAGTIRAKAALITVPTGVLAQAGVIRFDPLLPDWKRAAIDGLPMGLVNKVILQYQPGAIDADPGTWLIGRDANDRPGDFLLRPLGTDLVIGFFGGEYARELEFYRRGRAIDRTREVIGGLLGEKADSRLVRARMTGWGQDPWSRGAYSAALPGQAGMRRVLARPVARRLYFAGEACAEEWATQVAGAYLSGQEAARKILEDHA
jgi:monoamine oxidase